MELTIQDIEIQEFIFHIIHHGEDEATLMESTPIGKFEGFFKDRILEILKGNKFFFNGSSDFLQKIISIDHNLDLFTSVSKDLAVQFHTHQDKRIKPGVMILMKVLILSNTKFILIKYDNENVITYKRQGTNAVLEEISNTFSKSKEALQKSAVIEIKNELPYAIVIDYSNRKYVTDFFKGFLGIRRKYDNEELTEKVQDSFLSTVRKFKASLPPSFTSSLRQKFYDIVQSNDSFNPNDFLQIALGEYYKPEMSKTFERELKSNDMHGEEFYFHKRITRPRQKKYRTEEGVSIEFSYEAEDTVKISNDLGKTIITIETKKLLEE